MSKTSNNRLNVCMRMNKKLALRRNIKKVLKFLRKSINKYKKHLTSDLYYFHCFHSTTLAAKITASSFISKNQNGLSQTNWYSWCFWIHPVLAITAVTAAASVPSSLISMNVFWIILSIKSIDPSVSWHWIPSNILETPSSFSVDVKSKLLSIFTLGSSSVTSCQFICCFSKLRLSKKSVLDLENGRTSNAFSWEFW